MCTCFQPCIGLMNDGRLSKKLYFDNLHLSKAGNEKLAMDLMQFLGLNSLWAKWSRYHSSSEGENEVEERKKVVRRKKKSSQRKIFHCDVDS